MSSVGKISFKAENQNLFNSSRLTQMPIQNQYPNTQTSPPQVESVDNSEKKSQMRNAKNMTYVSSALALLSLGVAGAALIKGRKKLPKGNAEDALEPIKKSLTKINENLSGMDGKFEQIYQRIDSEVGNFNNTVGNIYSEINSKSRWHDGAIGGVKSELQNQMGMIAREKSQLTNNFFPVDVNINGRQMRLANVLNEIQGDERFKLERALQSEATQRILGFTDRSNKTPPDFAWVRMPTSEVRPYTNTGGLSIVPKELISNLAGMINTKQKAGLLLDTPLYTGNVANNQYYSLERNTNGSDTFNYVKKFFDAKDQKYKYENLAEVELIDTMHLPIYTDKGRTMEDVNVYLSKTITSKIDFDLLSARLDLDVLEDIEKTLKADKAWENELLKIRKDKDTGLPVAEAKYRTVFYDSQKFNMDGRTGVGNVNIYRNDAMETGETERMVYFSKFFTEHLMNGETSKVKLGADLIIGNDWHTGPISAMMRQLSTARKFYGMDPEKADSLHDTPIVTLMHNAGLAGNSWHSQEKLLNIMFGEHATKIVTNSFMPNVRIGDKGGLPYDLHNALMSKDCVHPQIMAANYSDLIVPVSENYSVEIASHSGFGGETHDIFKIRARMWEYADMSNIRFIAKQNGFDEKLVSEEPTMKGITNGCDAANNVLTEAKARQLEKHLGLENGTIKSLRKGDNVTDWHRHNKKVYLDKVISDINTARTSNGAANPMKVELPEMTDLTGVTADTPVYSTAGRIVDQKGLDIFAESILEFYKNYKGKDYPVFYAQGVGEEVYIQQMLRVKQELDKTNPEAAKRIVFARLFSEPGRYDGCKLMSDYSIMSSWFEPCGLVHKEIAKYSGAIPIVLKVGGLPAGLKDMENAIFANFMHKFEDYEKALAFNAKTVAEAMLKGADLMSSDKAKFAQMLESSQKTDHSWLVEDGPLDRYMVEFVKLKVFKPEILKVRRPIVNNVEMLKANETVVEPISQAPESQVAPAAPAASGSKGKGSRSKKSNTKGNASKA